MGRAPLPASGLPGEPVLIPFAEPGEVGIGAHRAALDLGGEDLPVGGERLPRGVDPEGGEEDLERVVGVEGAGDLGEPAEVPVDEARDPVGILHRPPTRAAADVERPRGQAEVALGVDHEELDVHPGERRRRERLLPPPGVGREPERRGIGPVLPGAGPGGVVERGQRQLAGRADRMAHGVPLSAQTRTAGSSPRRPRS